MEPTGLPAPPFWPVLLYCAAALAVVAGMVGVSYVLGQRHRERATGEPYESGIVAMGSARLRVSAKFYLIAMFFVIFDLESVFVFAWAVSAREVGWAGYLEVVVFIGILLATLVYLWRLGALDWVTPARRARGVTMPREGARPDAVVDDQAQ
jgi:NADH-quinone oxidoreductase subunit A